MDVSIVIPAYNEQGRIGGTLAQYLGFFASRLGSRLEVLVVLNGCTDGTEKLVVDLEERHPQLRHVIFSQRLGKGGAVQEGLLRARGARIAFVDADNMVGPAETARLLEGLDSADVAIGWRRGLGRGKPWPRRLASSVLRWWTRWWLGLPYHDTQCGAKAIRRSAAQALLPHLAEKGWAFDLELLVAAKGLGLAVVEVPVEWQHVQEGSKVRLFRDAFQVLRASLRLRRKLGPPRPPVS